MFTHLLACCLTHSLTHSPTHSLYLSSSFRAGSPAGQVVQSGRPHHSSLPLPPGRPHPPSLPPPPTHPHPLTHHTCLCFQGRGVMLGSFRAGSPAGQAVQSGGLHPPSLPPPPTHPHPLTHHTCLCFQGRGVMLVRSGLVHLLDKLCSLAGHTLPPSSTHPPTHHTCLCFQGRGAMLGSFRAGSPAGQAVQPGGPPV